MCGIIGQLAFGELNEVKEQVRREAMIFWGSELLQMTQVRGEDATGVSLLFEDGNYFGLKMGIAPAEFISRFGKNEKEYGGFIKAWRRTKRNAKVFLGHCRKKSRGSANNNNNNHPICVGDVVGIHNGTLDNDNRIFENLKCGRNGEVDSEAIIRLIHHYTKNGKEPFTTQMLRDIGQRLSGTYAVIAMSGNNPYQVCAFRDSKPIEILLVKPLSLVVLASEKKFLDMALWRFNKLGNLYMPEANFPTIEKDDIEFKTMQDDSGAIFDLTTKITAKTELGDLFDWEKIPREIVSGYEKETADTTYKKTGFYTGQNQWKEASSNQKKEDNPVGSKSTGKSSCKTGTGRVWSKKAGKYVENIDKQEVEKTKDKGNVEVNVDTGKIEELDKKGDSDGNGPFELEHDKDAEGGVISDSVEIKELDPPSEAETVEVDAAEVADKDSSTCTVEVNVEVDAESIAKANEAMRSEISFDSVDDVLEAFEIEDEKTLESLTPMALANRIRKFTLKEGFVRGYTARKKENSNSMNGSAEMHIRRLKALVLMTEEINRLSGFKTRDTVVEHVVINAFEAGVDLTKEGLDRIFTAGDDRNSKLIPLIKKIVACKQDR